MNLKEIKDLIELVNDKGFAEFEIERQGFRLRISRFKESPPTLVQPPPAPLIISAALPAAPEMITAGTRQQLTEGGAPSGSAPSTRKKTDDTRPAEPEIELRMIKSPIVGTFYRASSPNSEPFVRIGDPVEPDTVVCIIEAMKLMNEIQAEISGEIVKIYIENGQPVEYGQALFGVKTD